MQRTLYLNPENKTALWADIKAKRNELEVSPITITQGTFDADQEAIIRMDSAISSFDALPTLNAENKLGWKTYDNQIVFLNKTELESLRHEIAKRAALLHYNASLIANSSHIVKDLNNLSLWGI